MNQQKVRIALFIFSWAILTQSIALTEDKTLPITLNASIVDVSQKKGIGIYQGGVALDQGSSHLRADHAKTFFTEKNKLKRAIAYGILNKQAHCWTLPAKDKPILHAYADKISYFPETQYIVLSGHAKIIQGEDRFTAPIIRYNIAEQRITTKQTAEGRTTLTFHSPPKRARK